MKRALLPLGLVLFVLALDGPVVSRSNGMLPTPALPLTRDAASSCGGSGSGPGCHRLRPFLTEVSVAVGQRVLNLNGTTAVRVAWGWYIYNMDIHASFAD